MLQAGHREVRRTDVSDDGGGDVVAVADVSLGVHRATGKELHPKESVDEVLAHQAQGAEVGIGWNAAHKLLSKAM